MEGECVSAHGKPCLRGCTINCEVFNVENFSYKDNCKNNLPVDFPLSEYRISLNKFRPRIVFALEYYSQHTYLRMKWWSPSNSFAVYTCIVYGSMDSSIHCLKQNGFAAHAASRIFPLIGEMLAVPGNDDDNPFLTSGDEDKRTDCWRYGLISASYFLAKDIHCA